MERKFLVECCWPGVTEPDHAAAVARLRAAAAGLAPDGAEVELVGAVLVAADEVALHRFTAGSAEQVQQAYARAGLAFERILDDSDHPASQP